MAVSEITSPAREAVEEMKQLLVRIYGERLIYLYGSYARGEATKDSDVDVLIVLDGPVSFGPEVRRYNSEVSDICLRHNLLISTHPISFDEYEKSQSPFLMNVHKEALAI
jgi:predicted nucleotidyltransferase